MLIAALAALADRFAVFRRDRDTAVPLLRLRSLRFTGPQQFSQQFARVKMKEQSLTACLFRCQLPSYAEGFLGDCGTRCIHCCQENKFTALSEY